MSEVILKHLLQLFALIVKRDSGVSADERRYVEGFSAQQRLRDAATEYLRLFDKYTGRSVIRDENSLDCG
jgi:hypothetical protein